MYVVFVADEIRGLEVTLNDTKLVMKYLVAIGSIVPYDLVHTYMSVIVTLSTIVDLSEKSLND